MTNETFKRRSADSSPRHARTISLVMTTGLWVALAAGCWQEVDPGTCNDGIEDEGEECDDGEGNRDPAKTLPGRCTWECKFEPGCGDKKTNEDMGEECDDGREGSKQCTKDCQRTRVCGNKFVDMDVGEECDNGEANQALKDAMPKACTVMCREARCGNGDLEHGEECDESSDNMSREDAKKGQCTTECRRAACGDGDVNADEDCDDGNINDADGCPADCSCLDSCGNNNPDLECGETCDRGPEGDNMCSPLCQEHRCGDGVLGPDEDCDNGAVVDPNICTAECQSPTLPGACGNGEPDTGEECDDGNMVTTDGCVGCKKATCGDGFVWTGTEECDDKKNDGSYGSCSKDCKAKGPHCGDGIKNGSEQCDGDALNCLNCWLPRVVFVTKKEKSGNLGGLMGADALCQSEWNIPYNAGLPGTFEAWLSAGKTSAAERLKSTAFTGYYMLRDGTKVANGWAGLTTKKLLKAITQHADGTSLMDDAWAWTNTTRDGNIFQANKDCGGWTQNDGEGRTGKAAHGVMDSGWSSSTSSQCSPPNLNHLYCIQVQP